MPSEIGLDHTLGMLRDPYGYIGKRCAEYASPVFETRLLMQRSICMSGRDAAELFHDESRFTRAGAAPLRVQRTLLGRGGIQGTDGEEHRHRKAMYLALFSPERVADLVATTDRNWHARARDWQTDRRRTLYREAQEVLGRSVFRWAGVPINEAETGRFVRYLTAMFDTAGTIGPRHLWGRFARRRGDRWMREIITDIRGRRLSVPDDCIVSQIAWRRDRQGELYPPEIAAVELLNVLRPVVAVSVYITLAATAAIEQPEWRERLAGGDPDDYHAFVQEVRRYYPFFPALVARVRETFTWRGFEFVKGRRVLLEVYGTNHDPASWSSPEEFNPDRFLRGEGDAFSFIPQGGGVHAVHHRCPGEEIAIELMKGALRFLYVDIHFRMPPQDLTIDHSRVPALPRSHFVFRNVRMQAAAPAPVVAAAPSGAA